MKHAFSLLVFLCLSLLSTAQIDLEKNYSYDELKAFLDKAREENNHKNLADVYYRLGLFEKEKLSDDNQAYINFARSREYYQLIDNQAQIFVVDRLLIGKFMDSGLYSEAINSLTKMLEEYKDAENPSMKALLYLDLSKAYNGKGDVESELRYQNLALSQNKIAGDKELEVEILLSKIESYINLSELDSAMMTTNSVLASLTETSENNVNTCKALLKKGEIFYTQNNYENALASYNEAREYCGSKSYSKERLSLYDGLSKTYEKVKEYDKAYTQVKRYSSLNDSILNYERLKSLNNLSYKYNVQKQKKEFKQLELEKEKNLELNSQQRRALWVLGIGLAALSLLLYYTITVYNQRIQANKLINKQKEEINAQQISKLEDDIKLNSMQSMLEGQEIERERIAKDLHDSLGGVLSTIKLQFDSVQNKVPLVGEVRAYNQAHKLIDSAVDEVRSISQNLQPSALENLGLKAAIGDLINRFEGPSYPDIDLQVYNFPDNLDKMTCLYIYRMVQELLHNSIKHAEASEIMIQLTKDESELVIHFEDDGKGFDPENTRKGGMGMDNLRGRASYLKGSITLDSKIGEGSSFLIHIPHKNA